MLIYSMMICCLLSLSFTAAVPHRLDKSPCFPCQSCGNHGPWMIYSPWPMQSPFWLSIMGAWQGVDVMDFITVSGFCWEEQELELLFSHGVDSLCHLLPTAWKSKIQAWAPKDPSEVTQCLKPGPHYSSHCCRAGMSGTKPVPPNNLSLAFPSWVSK